MTLIFLRTVNKVEAMFLYPGATTCCEPSVRLFASGPKIRLNIFGTCAAVIGNYGRDGTGYSILPMGLLPVNHTLILVQTLEKR